LDQSALVAFTERVPSGRVFRITLADSALAWPWRHAQLALDEDHDVVSALELQYSWIGNDAPTEAELREMASVGDMLMDELRRRCLPDVPRSSSCVVTNFISSDPCPT